MNRPSLAHLALLAIMALGTACGGAQTHAESATITPSDDSASKSEPQFPESAIGKTDDAKTASTAPKPETSSAAEDAIVSGNALPPSPNGGTTTVPKAAKPTKAKKPGKSNKKGTQTAQR